MDRTALLEVSDLTVEFPQQSAVVRAAQGLTLSLAEGEIVGLVGESGCGKSASALALLRLVPPPGRIVSGRVRLDGVDLLALPEKELRRYRGAGMAYVPQEPGQAFSPVISVGAQVVDVIRAHHQVDRKTAWSRAVAALEAVGIADPARRAREYPHQYSGGMKQRALVAMALAAGPRVLIADEPTTAIDPTLQAGILELFRSLVEQGRLGALLLITHDLSAVARICHRVLVMYAGRIVERAPTAEVLAHPLHPYTRALLASRPRPEHPRGGLPTIEGQVPDLAHLPPGCAFAPRCPVVEERCRQGVPPAVAVSEAREVACILETGQ